MRSSSSISLGLLIFFFLACSPASGEKGPGDQPPQAAATAVDSLEGDFLYQAVTLRAAPGRLLDLIEMLKEERDLMELAGEPAPLWMRHTQGDQWDLLILYPMGGFHEYYEPVRTERRLEAGTQKGMSERQLRIEVDAVTSWRDEMFVRGPDLPVVEAAFDLNGYYHVEMFVALAGRRRELLEERRMENHYLRELGRPQNLLFVREAGGPWDSFTLGFYRDIKHYSESADISAEAEDRAAKAAGFQGADQIGSYLRRFLLYHRDTLCVAIG